MTSMRFSLRTLLIVMLLAGPLCALGWSKFNAWLIWREEQMLDGKVAWKNSIGGARQVSTTGMVCPIRVAEEIVAPSELQKWQAALKKRERDNDVDLVAMQRLVDELSESPLPESAFDIK